jgi:hypothetical protein
LIAFSERQDRFPKLPIVTPDPPAPPARAGLQKYGGLLHLGLIGLSILVALMAWFAIQVWQMRDVWANIYILHNPARSEADRIQAAFALSRDSRVNDAQLMQMCLERDLPDLARYLLAEAVRTDAVVRDPRGYTLSAVRSPEWPEWLRLLLGRRIAYGTGRGLRRQKDSAREAFAIPSDSLEELARHPDPMIVLWADYAMATGPDAADDAVARLKKAARGADERAELAKMLVAALDGSPSEREDRLDQATIWMRHHHPQAAKIWQGYVVQAGKLIKVGTK